MVNFDKILFGFFLLIIGLLIVSWVIAILTSNQPPTLITDTLPLDRTGFTYGCIQVPGLIFSDENRNDIIINQETNNNCQVKREIPESNFAHDREKKEAITPYFIAIVIEENCDDLIGNYSNYLISAEKKVYQCMKEAFV